MKVINSSVKFYNYIQREIENVCYNNHNNFYKIQVVYCGLSKETPEILFEPTHN